MGIAAADLDSSGTTDFFVTNFRDEPNTLYLQLAPGLFQDVSRTSGLDSLGCRMSAGEPSFSMQIATEIRTSSPSMVTSKTTVIPAETSKCGPQLFRNQGQLQFEEVTAEEAGPWLARKSLGRALATLDWNRDGRMDFVVGNINSPVALVENQSSPIGPSIELHLHAVSSDRDAWFTTVVLDNGQTQIREQLRAGSGYHASSQRALQLTPGTSPLENNTTTGLTLTVTWPSGNVVTLTNVPIDCRLHLTENRSDVCVVPK
jgi:hypothetical protein